MKLKVFPSNELQQECKELDPEHFDVACDDFYDADFLRVLHNGAALAAPQVGLLERWWVMPFDDEESCAIVNPVVTVPTSGPKINLSEGCLSLPRQKATVKRWPSVKVSGLRIFFNRIQDEPPKIVAFEETWTGHRAQIAQHEMDHLDGLLYTHLLPSSERSRIHGTVRKLKVQGKL